MDANSELWDVWLDSKEALNHTHRQRARKSAHNLITILNNLLEENDSD